MPSRHNIKDTVLPKLKSVCQSKIQTHLTTIPSIKTSIDAWTDAAVRPFNGFIAQGIDMDWNLHTLPIEFEYINGNYLMFVYGFNDYFSIV